MLRLRVPPITLAFISLVLTLVLAACGGDSNDDSDRSFAPEARGDVALPTDTPAPTPSVPPLNRQPGESSTNQAGNSGLFTSTGRVTALMSGLTRYAVVDLATGESREINLARQPATLVEAAPDGKRILVIDRSRATIVVRLLTGDGKVAAEWSPKRPASPVASPVASSNAIRSGDVISWRSDGSAAIVALSGQGLFLADASLKMTRLPAFDDLIITAVAWSLSGGSIVAGTWDQATNSASLITAAPSEAKAPAIKVLGLPDGDGRFVRSIGWGSERVGIVFALRSFSSNFSLPNDLYYLPKFGEPMRLLATAGLAAPAAVVDRVAIAGNGTTIAFSVLIPSGSGLRFHSLWVTDALASAPVQADTTGLRRVTDLQWSKEGLVVSGTRRQETGDAAYQVAVVERLSESEPTGVASIRSDATPAASPVASPVARMP